MTVLGVFSRRDTITLNVNLNYIVWDMHSWNVGRSEGGKDVGIDIEYQ